MNRDETHIFHSTLCVASGNVYKQTTPEIPEVTCTRHTIMSFLHETSLIWGYQPGGEIMTILLLVVTHMQRLSYQCQVYDKCRYCHRIPNYQEGGIGTFNRFIPAPFVCLSQSRTCISNVTCCCVFMCSKILGERWLFILLILLELLTITV